MELYGKSPKMWVNEICVKTMVQPKWNVREAFPGPPPTFICSCTIAYTDRSIIAEATGKTKKEAEQEAAKEMLLGKDKLAMTPAQLMNLSNKGNAGGASSASSTSNGDMADVSDTDDNELASAEEPISGLFAICTQHNFEDPIYEDEHTEGPPHKRIFTVKCIVKEAKVACSGRRYKKQTAKKVAAFRTLRMLKGQGFNFIPFETPNGISSVDGVDRVGETAILGVDIEMDKIVSHFNKVYVAGGTGELDVKEQRELLLKIGSRLYCNDHTEKCLAKFMNYPHAFQHLPPCSLMDQTLGNPNVDFNKTIEDHGGPVRLLTRIVRDMKVQATFMPGNKPAKTGEVMMFLSLKFPFNFKYNIPKIHMVHGLGATKPTAKENAAMKAFDLFKVLFYYN